MNELIGAKIVKIERLDQKIVEELGWYNSTIAIHLDNGIVLFASRDEEGNDAGNMWYTKLGKMAELEIYSLNLS